jgi:hypothetical protein
VAGISEADKQAIGEQWARNLQPHMAAFAAAAPAAAAPPAGIDPQKLFCEQWPTIKQALQFLQGVIPQPGPILIGLIIAAGDAAHNNPKVCP